MDESVWLFVSQTDGNQLASWKSQSECDLAVAQGGRQLTDKVIYVIFVGVRLSAT